MSALEKLSTIETTLAIASEALEAGESVDLAELEREVMLFCADAGSLPIDKRQEATARMQQILLTLDRLTAELTKRRDGLQQQLGRTTNSKHAAQAYLKAKKE